MSHYRRWRKPGAWIFFTVVTYKRQPLFNNPIARRILRDAIIETQQSHPFDNFAFVLMPNHLHCVWVLPPNDDDYSTRWRLIKSRTTHELLASGWTGIPEGNSRKRTGEKTVWQRRYWEKILTDDEELKRYVDYLHYNPVKHGLVEQLTQWPYSSLFRFVESGEYPEDWGCCVPDSLKNWAMPDLE